MERNALIKLFRTIVALLISAMPPFVSLGQGTNAVQTNTASLIVVVGAAGEEDFGTAFASWASAWVKTGEAAKVRTVGIGNLAIGTNAVAPKPSSTTSTNATADIDLLKHALETETKDGLGELWLVLIGHGTFDGKVARLNLRGKDVSSTDLAGWLAPFKRPVAVIDCTSSSGPFMKALSGQGRVVVTSTKSGHEQNYSRFGRDLSEALINPDADLDKDGQTSLLELYSFASARVAEFYKSEGRLSTEHALLDDNGDGLGTPPEFFRGVRAVKKPQNGEADGLRAHQLHLVRSELEQMLSPLMRSRRDDIERSISKLRDNKGKMAETAYDTQLERMLLDLAWIYERAGKPPEVVKQRADGSVLLRARDAEVHGVNLRYEPQPYKNTLGYWTRKDDWASWQVKIENAGKFQVSVLQACGKGSGGSEYTLSFAGQEMKDTVPDTGAFTNFVTRTLGSLSVKEPGLHTFTVKPTTKPGAAVMDLRLITLTPVKE